MESVRGKVAIVTGASSGIGWATALAFAQAGMHVIAAARRESELQELVRACEAAGGGPGGGTALAVPTDVADRASVDALVRTAIERYGGVDVLVASAGTNVKRRAFSQLSQEDWQRVVDINLTGIFNCAQASLEPMLRRGGGLMVFISSMAAKRQNAVTGAAYTATKHGVWGIASTLLAEEQRNGIRVTVIYPGVVDTPILQSRPNPPSAEALREALQPQDVAETCLFLARLPARCTIPEITMVPTRYTG